MVLWGFFPPLFFKFHSSVSAFTKHTIYVQDQEKMEICPHRRPSKNPVDAFLWVSHLLYVLLLSFAGWKTPCGTCVHEEYALFQKQKALLLWVAGMDKSWVCRSVHQKAAKGWGSCSWHNQDPPYLLPLASFVWLLSLPQKCLIHFPSSHPCSALCGSGTSYIVQAGLQLRDSPALPPSTRIKGVCTTPGQYQYHFL